MKCSHALSEAFVRAGQPPVGLSGNWRGDSGCGSDGGGALPLTFCGSSGRDWMPTMHRTVPHEGEHPLPCCPATFEGPLGEPRA